MEMHTTGHNEDRNTDEASWTGRWRDTLMLDSEKY